MPSKILVGASLSIMTVIATFGAVVNAARGDVSRPWCFLITLVGLVAFLIPKVAVIRHKKRISFGTRLMTEGQANAYRVGYFLMLVGVLYTFQ